jgi:hypothetical protein
MKGINKGEVVALFMGLFLGLLISSFWVISWVSDSKEAETTFGLLIKYALPLLLDALLTYGAIATYLSWRENKKWSGIKTKTLEDCASVYNWVFTAVSVAITTDHPLKAESMLKNTAYRHERLKNLLTMSGTGLGSDTLPRLLNITETIDLLLPKVKFLITSVKLDLELKANKQSGLFVMSSVPASLSELKKQVEDCLSESKDISSSANLHDPLVMKDNWAAFKTRVNLRDDIGARIDVGRRSKILVYDIETMTQTSLNAEVDCVVETFHY